ncbi:retrovirus-related pol polyprotein from transposon TNT 1-94 [Tanacetum coccineum]|uniref:Retrovirus-related pol polyprotein from transposon TNT 1-94 n=1 Tax=Tanacetum coccineum TaxID=301880 RepID=A0ABQ5IHX3_9ASTR
MTTLANKAILSGADNRLPMLEKDMYDSWKSIMELYMMNRQHGRMILESIENGPLIWPTIEENGVTRPRKYSELTPTDAIQADCDVKATNIILQGLPPEVYALDPLALVATHQITQSPYQTHQNSYQNSQFQPQVSLYQSPRYGSTYQSQQHLNNQSSTPFSITYPSNDYQSSVHHNVYSSPSSIPQIEYAPIVNQQQQQQPEFPQLDLGLTVLVFKQGDDPIDSINHMMSFLLAVFTSRYPTTNNQLRNSRTYTPGASGSNSGKQRSVISQANGQILHEEELAFLADPGIAEVALMANLSHYGSDALAEVHNPDNVNNNMTNQVVQAMPSSKQSSVVNHSETGITSDSNIIPYSRYMTESQQAVINLDNKSVNDTLTAELERYKEQVKVLKEGQNVDLKSKDNISDSCKPSVEIDRLKQTLSEQSKEKESLMQTVTLLKNDFKKEESRNIDREIALEKKIKQLDNINTSAIVIPESEETLMLAEESRSKMLLKQQDPMMLEKKVNITPVDYVNSVNSLEPTLSSRPINVESKKRLKLTEYVFEQNERLLKQSVTNSIVNIIMNSSVDNAFVNVHECEKCLKLETELLNKKNFVEKVIYDKLFKSFTTLEKHCISLEVDTQLNQEIFQRDNSVSNQRVKPSTSASGSQPLGNTKKDKIQQTPRLGHNLFSVRQFCDSNLEVAFRQHTCFIRNLEGVDLLTGSRGNNLYTLSLGDMMASSPICLLSKALKTKSWLWHRRLSHLNFGVINHLARHGLVRGLPKLKFEKDHLCSACAMGKSKKKPHKPKSEDTNQEKLYLLHMDLCGPIRVASVNEKKYILVIINDYSRFTWIKCLRTDNGTEFVNQTLREYYEKVGISHETSVARSPQQNGVIERPSPKKQLLPQDILFQSLFDKLLTPPPSVDHPAPKVIAPIAEVVALDATASTGSPSSKTVDQDAPSPINSQTTPKSIFYHFNDLKKTILDLDVAHMNNDPFFGIPIPENDSEASSSSDVIPTVVHTATPNSGTR